MAIYELSEEQVRSWSREQKDRWWFENVFRGDMPQLTLRSALTGMGLGAILSLTNIYVGAKTGWTLGVGITSVILAFAMFKALSRLGLAREFTILENNAMQSIATASGYMTGPLISSLAAYMMVTGQVIPMYQTMSWIIVLAILGVLFAFPFKRRFINEEQLPFPEGREAGIVMDSLHHGEAATGVLKAKLLVAFAVFAALVKLFQSETITAYLTVKDFTFRIPEFLDEWLYKITGTPSILGTPVTNLTLRPEIDLPMVGAGGLMGIRTGTSLLIGATINYALLAPIMINRGDIVPNAAGMNGLQQIAQWSSLSAVATVNNVAMATIMVNSGDIVPKVASSIGFREIQFWSLWCGVAMMTIASLVSFFGKPKIIWAAFKNLTMIGGNRTGDGSNDGDVLRHIELPLSVSILGVPVIGAIVVWMAHDFFGVAYWMSVVAIAMVFFFCLIAITSTGLTSITPIGPMGKLTQLAFGVLVPGDKVVNLMMGSIAGEVASNSSNLLQDIKPGYMLGAKPRQQAMGHVLGIFAGAVLSVPIFYLVFLKVPPSQLTASELSVPYEMDAKYAMPSATLWKAVADVLAEGIHTIRPTAQYTALAGMVIGVAMELWRLATRNRFPLSAVAIGLGFLIPFHTCLSMFAGSFFFWLTEKLYSSRESRVNQVVVQNQEPICAGLIAGGALMGIALAVADLFLATE